MDREKVKFKTNFGNKYIQPHITLDTNERKFVYMGINEFSSAGFGYEKDNAILNQVIKTDDYDTTKQYMQSFEEIWKDNNILKDVTEEVAGYISNLYKENSPEFIYYLTLFNIFDEFLEDISEDELANEKTGFKQSVIWNKLYDFQRDAVLGIINKLERHNGCILADSVGLGKTFTALGVIKYYQERNRTVLVLCPKKLGDNWQTFGISKTEKVTEIQIFELELKEQVIPERVLKVIDRAIPYQILYKFQYKGSFAWGITLKEGNKAENYYFSEWDETVLFDFTGIDLEKVYQKLVKAFIEVGSETKKDFSGLVASDTSKKQLQNEITVLDTKMHEIGKETDPETFRDLSCLSWQKKGSRKFIMVQLPEKTDQTSEAYKARYKSIADIGKERIRRAGKKILEEMATKNTKKHENKAEEPDLFGAAGEENFRDLSCVSWLKNLDIGFRVYKTDTTNMKDIFYHPTELQQTALDGLTSNIKEDRTSEDLLTQVLLDLGLELSLPIETKKIHGNTVFIVQTNSLVACFDDDINFKIMDEIADLQPLKVVFKDASFKDDKDRINVEERFKRLSPETRNRVL